MRCNIFTEQGAKELVNRINELSDQSIPNWGRMKVGQMLAHCADAFVEEGENPPLIICWIIRLTRRRVVIGLKPYPKNMKTSKTFIPKGDKDFGSEKDRLLSGIVKAQKRGCQFFQNRWHPIFGILTCEEWNTFFVKHIDHHLRQFGV